MSNAPNPGASPGHPEPTDPLAQALHPHLQSPTTLPPTAPDLSLTRPQTPGPQLPALPRHSIALNLDAGSLPAALNDSGGSGVKEKKAAMQAAEISMGNRQRDTTAGSADAGSTRRSARSGGGGFFRAMSIRSFKSAARTSLYSPSSPTSKSMPLSPPTPATTLPHEAFTGTGWFSPSDDTNKSKRMKEEREAQEAERMKGIREGKGGLRRPNRFMRRLSSGMSMKRWNVAIESKAKGVSDY